MPNKVQFQQKLEHNKIAEEMHLLAVGTQVIGTSSAMSKEMSARKVYTKVVCTQCTTSSFVVTKYMLKRVKKVFTRITYLTTKGNISMQLKDLSGHVTRLSPVPIVFWKSSTSTKTSIKNEVEILFHAHDYRSRVPKV